MGSAGHQPQSCELSEFYRDTGVLVVGERNLITTVLVEKLLRSCTDLSHVFLLVEQQPDKRAQDVVDQVLGSPYFDELKHQWKDFPSRVVGVTGNVKECGLGLSDADRRRLAAEVGVVFHVVDSSGPHLSLRDNILRDVRGPREMLALCRSFVKLKSIVFMSSMRAVLSKSTTVHHICEQIYEPVFAPSQAIDLAERLEEHALTAHVARLMDTWPDRRTYLQAISEHVVKIFGQGLPVAIVRSPAVLTSEVGVASSSGELTLTTVPCDITVNCMIASARKVQGNRCSSVTRVFNCMMPSVADPKPLRASLTARWLVTSVLTILHSLLSVVLSRVLALLAKEEMLIPLCAVLSKCVQDKPPKKDVKFSVDNVGRLWQSMSPWDKREFDFDLIAIHRRIEQGRVVKNLQSRLRRDPGLAEQRTNKPGWRPGVSQCVFFGLTFWLAWAVIYPLNVTKVNLPSQLFEKDK